MLYAIDFGTGDALAIHGPDGPVSKKLLKLPRVPGGRTKAMEFPMFTEALMNGKSIEPGDVVVESATLGSSGCEVSDIITLLADYPERKLYTVTTRAVKNYRKDQDRPWRKGARYAKDGDAPVEVTVEEQAEVHLEDAEIIYRIATETPHRLYHWTGPSAPLTRIHTSVRPMDKREYRDERAEDFMNYKLPPYHKLPQELRDVLGDGIDYARAKVMPFAMATEEPHLDDGPIEERRRRFEKIIGLYDRGYPSFYRRATIVWMHTVAKQMTGASKIEEVSPEQRKAAWKITQRQIRMLFHLAMAWQER